MKVYEIGSKRFKITIGVVFILMVLGILFAIYKDRIDMLIIAVAGTLYALYFVIPLYILKKPLMIIDQVGLRVRNKRVNCSYDEIESMNLYGQKNRQILVLMYQHDDKIIKRTLDDVYDLSLEEIKQIIDENIRQSKAYKE